VRPAYYRIFWFPFAYFKGDVFHMTWYGYGSISINSIFKWMIVHLKLFWCSPGVQGFDTLPHLMAEIWWLVNSPWWLGISCTSIFQYDFEKMTITKFFWVYAYLTNPYGLINH
jgi:hypothetical protein